MRVLKACFSKFWFTCLLTSTTTVALAFDSDAYTGTWKNSNPALTLEIGTDSASINLDGVAYTDNDLHMVPSQLSTAPFLYLSTHSESGQQAYHFYLMSSTNEQDKPVLNGYYDQIALDQDGNKVATQSFPLNMEQTQQQLTVAK